MGQKAAGSNPHTAVMVLHYKATAVMAGGQSGDVRSPHFADQLARYAEGRLRPVYFHPDELTGHVERTYRPGY